MASAEEWGDVTDGGASYEMWDRGLWDNPSDDDASANAEEPVGPAVAIPLNGDDVPLHGAPQAERLELREPMQHQTTTGELLLRGAVTGGAGMAGGALGTGLCLTNPLTAPVAWLCGGLGSALVSTPANVAMQLIQTGHVDKGEVAAVFTTSLAMGSLGGGAAAAVTVRTTVQLAAAQTAAETAKITTRAALTHVATAAVVNGPIGSGVEGGVTYLTTDGTHEQRKQAAIEVATNLKTMTVRVALGAVIVVGVTKGAPIVAQKLGLGTGKALTPGETSPEPVARSATPLPKSEKPAVAEPTRALAPSKVLVTDEDFIAANVEYSLKYPIKSTVHQDVHRRDANLNPRLPNGQLDLERLARLYPQINSRVAARQAERQAPRGGTANDQLSGGTMHGLPPPPLPAGPRDAQPLPTRPQALNKTQQFGSPALKSDDFYIEQNAQYIAAGGMKGHVNSAGNLVPSLADGSPDGPRIERLQGPIMQRAAELKAEQRAARVAESSPKPVSNPEPQPTPTINAGVLPANIEAVRRAGDPRH